MASRIGPDTNRLLTRGGGAAWRPGMVQLHGDPGWWCGMAAPEAVERDGGREWRRVMAAGGEWLWAWAAADRAVVSARRSGAQSRVLGLRHRNPGTAGRARARARAYETGRGRWYWRSVVRVVPGESAVVGAVRGGYRGREIRTIYVGYPSRYVRIRWACVVVVRHGSRERNR